MMYFKAFTHSLFVAVVVSNAIVRPAAAGLVVKTSSGTVQGHINDTTPEVRRWLGIHYAEAPTGNFRWMPPVAINDSNRAVDGDKYSASCPQYEEAGPYLDSEVREFLCTGPISEDCLTLSVYAPKNPTNASLPVFIWIHGGSLQVGGSTVPYEDPSKWVQRTQSHIVVGIQYRLNVFGFPNAPCLESQNLGYLDQRMGIKWVQQNIAAFGGDSSRMILFGQSAGGQSTDSQNFMWPDDPVVSGFIPISGSSMMGLQTEDAGRTDFHNLAEHFNCRNHDDAAELGCMRKVPFQDIIAHMQDKALGFFPFVDEKTAFKSPVQRLADGHISDRPVLYTTTLNEGIGFVDFPEHPETQAPDLDAARDFTLSAFTCPAVRLTEGRNKINRPTWQAEYRGNFTNISRRWWVGAWHSADLPLIFGTAGDYMSKATDFETEVSLKMQDLYLAFALDPHHGLEKAGWPQASQGKLMAFATNANATGHGGNTEGVAAKLVSLAGVNDACKDVGGPPPPGGGRLNSNGENP